MKSPKQFTEDELMQGIKENKREVFEYLYLKLTPIIYSDIRNNSGSKEDAEDHFQETLLAAIANVKTGRYERGNFEGYFRRVSKNLWLKKLRDSGKYRSIEFQDHHDSPDELSYEFAEKLIEYDHTLDLVNGKLNEMDESCKNVLNLFYYEKRGLDEIAKQSNWEYSYAKKKIFLCRQRLKEMLQTDKRFQIQNT